MRKVLLCFPWHEDFSINAKSLGTIEKYRVGGDTYQIDDCLVTVEEAQTAYVGVIRNYFVTGNYEIKKKGTKLRPFDEWIYCDSDNPWTEIDFLKILGHDFDIVCFPYPMKDRPEIYNAKINGKHVPITTKGLLPVEGHGMGGLVKIKRKVFEKLEPYWFFIPEIEKDGILSWKPEDYYFCKKARKAGFKCIVDFDNPLEHINTQLKRSNKMSPVKEVKLFNDLANQALKINEISGGMAKEYSKAMLEVKSCHQIIQEQNKKIAELEVEIKKITTAKPVVTEDDPDQKKDLTPGPALNP